MTSRSRPERAVIPQPRNLGLKFHPPLHTTVKNHVPSYTESADFYPISPDPTPTARRYGLAKASCTCCLDILPVQAFPYRTPYSQFSRCNTYRLVFAFRYIFTIPELM
ncbi:MAG: hypothetical protein AB4063_16370 [Crocosphaera sp.]